MKIAFFSTKPYDIEFFRASSSAFRHTIEFHDFRLHAGAARLAEGCEAVCVFVNDIVDRATLKGLVSGGTRVVALRCAGFNNVDLAAAKELGIAVVRVPAYSPYAVAEHTLGLLLALNRRLYRSYNRVREGNFSLVGLVGFDVHGLTVGIVGTGTIGEKVAKLFNGFGCRLLCYDVRVNSEVEALGAEYVEFDQLLADSDIITLHCPLMKATYHLIDESAIAKMKQGVTLLNTSRGGLVDTMAVVNALKSGKIGNLGIDVYEEEDRLFFEDQSARVMTDDVFARLLTFPNVLITGHQAFFTKDALLQIAETTLRNLSEFEASGSCSNAVEA
ncbi:2-hydroxyacid dehydrogenase [Pelagicoccus sp. SDUM812002]|uniref:2-hydroxyacid dehydrogenase n=1 Tax=Pelagicoccus sp. SDUM812002 TaxID=3041266 RepID=UPI00280D6176|nr:2-hydroxyacid dehydrogenase [Pelagicoccus sp. SDUM812002]MDQ8186170.1 2-hydroxyacid dehydrogenase [Pelagicoccus sp. SDUM812002]